VLTRLYGRGYRLASARLIPAAIPAASTADPVSPLAHRVSCAGHLGPRARCRGNSPVRERSPVIPDPPTAALVSLRTTAPSCCIPPHPQLLRVDPRRSPERLRRPEISEGGGGHHPELPSSSAAFRYGNLLPTLRASRYAPVWSASFRALTNGDDRRSNP
jgi:hypothetical protein